MARVEASTTVEVPLWTAYNQWTQFEEFPRFMEGVEEVRQIDDAQLYWRARISGKVEEWVAEITEQTPGQSIAWHSTTGAANAGRVAFSAVDSRTTTVSLVLEYTPRNVVEQMSDLLLWRVEGDLQRFKKFIESRGTESGAWRGAIHGKQVVEDPRQAAARSNGNERA